MSGCRFSDLFIAPSIDKEKSNLLLVALKGRELKSG
jgi:hypothetical protein